ncbi:TonB-dependent receptor [Paraneptunicella aestuarii]|uniref:TonB-dependent receptor n=1 Tax=Paraneptunicella aestuarii TaxID=2831148 RepID=UPI001E4AAC4A|nr:TonB-dependent receptor [Paraneptunicella aestuarii]UAA39615.1 TonB-dependent receptor [Paraneptunicella aestuarii]
MKNTIFNKSVVSTAIGAALSVSMPGVVVAQEQGAQQQKQYEVIEVTANRRTQSIQDVPYNISAMSGSELEEGSIQDASEMMRNIAGITVVDRGYRNSGTVNGVIIRGVNVDNGANGDVPLSAVPTVASYIGETPLYANFILKDIEMVEVLRGPQGTLYGSGSLAGTVKYRMNKPETDEFSGNVSVNVSQTDGSEGNNLTTDLLLNIPLSDNLAVRANIGKVDNDGIIDYTNVYVLDSNNYAPVPDNGDLATGGPKFRSVEDADYVDIEYGRISALYQASEGFSILLSHQFQQDDIGGRRQTTTGNHWVNGTEEAYGEYENGAVLLEPSERDVSLTALEIEVDLGFATLTSSSSVYDHEGQATSDNTGFYAQQNWFQNLYYGSPRPLAKANRGYKDEAFVQEVRLVSNERVANMDWVAGFYYMDNDSYTFQDSFMPGYQEWAGAAFDWWPTMENFGMVYTDNDFRYRRNVNFKDKALFGELTYHFSDEFRATVGVRAFKNEYDNKTDLSLPIWPYLGAQPNFKTDENDTLFKVNLSYDISDETMVYATVSEGYRRGGANAVPLDGNLAERPEWQQYNSDMATNYEVGVKGRFGDGMHSYTLSAFRLDWDNPQLNTASTWGFFTVANGESAQTQGLEFELYGYLTDSLHYVLGYAMVQAELTDDFYAPSSVSAASSTRLVAEDGSELPLAPEHTFSLSLDYTHELDNGMYWVSQANMYYQSDSLNWLGDDPARQADIDGFAVVNVSTRLSADDWDLTLYIKNLTNEEGITGLITEGHMGTDPAENFLGNSSRNYISLPRTIGLSATYRF